MLRHKRIRRVYAHLAWVCRGEAAKSFTGQAARARTTHRGVDRYVGTRYRSGLDGRPPEFEPAEIVVAGHTHEASCADVASCCRERTGTEQRCVEHMRDLQNDLCEISQMRSRRAYLEQKERWHLAPFLRLS